MNTNVIGAASASILITQSGTIKYLILVNKTYYILLAKITSQPSAASGVSFNFCAVKSCSFDWKNIATECDYDSLKMY